MATKEQEREPHQPHRHYPNVWQREQLIERYRQLQPDIPSGVQEGWQPVVGEAALVLDYAAPGWRCAQIKEKFGGLRFYIDPPDDADEVRREVVYVIEGYAERKAAAICEWCGDRGQLRPYGWQLTLCDYCHERHQAGERPWDEQKS